MAIADVVGGTLSYELAGQPLDARKPPVALLLPQSSGPVGLGPFIERLAERHAVITYDQRGTGGSSPMPDEMTMATQAGDVVALLDAIGTRHATLVCHSTGCGIGLAVAARHADRVARLILASPWTHADAHLSTMQNLRIAAARALDPVQYARFNAALLFPPEFRRAHQAAFERLAEAAVDRPQDAGVIERRLNAILAFDARPVLPTIGHDALIMAAGDDQLMPIWFAREAAGLLGAAELVELDGGGHMILETRATEVADAVLRFLDGDTRA